MLPLGERRFSQDFRRIMCMKNHLLATVAVVALIPTALRAQTVPAPTAPSLSTTDTAAAPAAAPAEDIIVTGTRQLGRTRAESPAPVDVISGAELERTGQQNVFDALNTLLPSFDLPAEGFDTAGLVRSARLRGLSPDDVLVLVDGKRRHVSANINADVGPSGGSDPVDLDTIPISLIDHIEVLRDGAAAQYGSDAIAGVINIILKHNDHGGDAFAQEGATYVQDGFTNNIGGSIGTKLGADGFFDLAADYRYHDHTDRSGQFPVLNGLFSPTSVTSFPSHNSEIEGDPRYNLVNVGYNAGYSVSPELEFYSFATYTYRHAEAFENFRTPGTTCNSSGAYYTYAEGFTCNGNAVPTTPPPPYGNLTASKYYPGGFEPLETLNEDDYSGTIGAKGDFLDDYHYDLSTTYGGDIDNIGVIETLNPSYLQEFGSSPTHVHAGEFNDTEWTTNLDFSKPFDLPFFAKPLSVAIGGEYRRNSYAINAGDLPSTYGGGAQAYDGFSKADAGYYSRSNEAVYLDLATSPLPNWQVDGAARFEHYSDFGDTETGKFTTRYDFSPMFGIRGTISNGFRAPTLAQEGYSGVNVGPTTAGGQFPVNSPGAALLGAQPLKPERSQNYSVGIVAQPIERMHVGLDVYRIDIRDQIVDSGLITNANIIKAFNLDGFGIPAGVIPANVVAQYYTNGVATKNEGVELTIDYTQHLTDTAKINWLLAGDANSTVITHVDPSAQETPDVLSEIKESTPKSKIVLQANFIDDPYSVTLRETRYGQVVEIFADGSSGSSPYTWNRNRPAFITDLELGYKITKELTLTLGANNLFDKYANHTTADSRYHNAVEYIASSPYGIDGGVYYGRLNFKFGDKPKPLPPAEPPALINAPPVLTPVRTYLVFFDWDRADLTERARQIVAQAAQASTHVQTTKIEVNGYTDLSGTAAYNQKLSIRRAKTVEAELVHDGVAESEIDIHGYGETNPLIPTAKGVREPQNRRVEIILK
jgi:iron complex outermembrane receptor protein